MSTTAPEKTTGVLEAVRVHVENLHEIGGTPAATPAPKKRYRAHYETFVLTANDPVQCILPEDPTRIRAYVKALDNDIVIGTKGQVQVANNTVTAVPQPVGTYVQKSDTAPYPVIDCDAVHAGVTTVASSSRVSVAAYYQE